MSNNPVSITAPIGANVNFSVTVGGNPLAYRWRDNGNTITDGGQYVGTTTTNFTLLGVQGANADSYSVVITNHGGTITSTTATLSTPPQITGPNSVTNDWHTTATLTITVTGTTNKLAYRWQSNTVANPTNFVDVGVTNKTLTIASTNVDSTLSNVGFRVIVTNSISYLYPSSGIVTSAVAYVRVRATSAAIDFSSTNICDVTNFVTISESPSTTDTMSYQWKRNGTAISGATASWFTTNSAGSYTVVITNNWGNDTSASRVLRAVTSPSILVGPQSQTVLLGNHVRFSASATGTSPITYSWIQTTASATNVLAIGVNLTNYTIASVADTDAGSYAVQAANICTPATSTPAGVLTVLDSPICATNLADASLLDWWKFESNVVDSVSNYDGTASSVTYAPGKVNTAIQFDGTSSGSLTFGTNAANFGTNNFTVECWVKTTNNNIMALMEKWQECDACIPGWSIRIGRNGVGDYPGVIGFEMFAGGPTNNTVACTNYPILGIAVNDGQWHHVAVVRSGLSVSLYVDAFSITNMTTRTVVNVNNNTSFQMGRSICECCDGTRPFNGSLDEVAFYNRALSAIEISAIYNASYLGRCSP